MCNQSQLLEKQAKNGLRKRRIRTTLLVCLSGLLCGTFLFLFYREAALFALLAGGFFGFIISRGLILGLSSERELTKLRRKLSMIPKKSTDKQEKKASSKRKKKVDPVCEESATKAMLDMVVITTVSQPLDATLIQLELDSFGIESKTTGDLTISVDPLLSNAIGGIKVLVSAVNAENASEIIEKHRQAKDQADRVCPECGNKNGIIIKHSVLIVIFLILTIGAGILLYPWFKYKCPKCGNKWK